MDNTSTLASIARQNTIDAVIKMYPEDFAHIIFAISKATSNGEFAVTVPIDTHHLDGRHGLYDMPAKDVLSLNKMTAIHQILEFHGYRCQIMLDKNHSDMYISWDMVVE